MSDFFAKSKISAFIWIYIVSVWVCSRTSVLHAAAKREATWLLLIAAVDFVRYFLEMFSHRSWKKASRAGKKASRVFVCKCYALFISDLIPNCTVCSTRIAFREFSMHVLQFFFFFFSSFVLVPFIYSFIHSFTHSLYHYMNICTIHSPIKWISFEKRKSKRVSTRVVLLMVKLLLLFFSFFIFRNSCCAFR